MNSLVVELANAMVSVLVSCQRVSSKNRRGSHGIGSLGYYSMVLIQDHLLLRSRLVLEQGRFETLGPGMCAFEELRLV